MTGDVKRRVMSGDKIRIGATTWNDILSLLESGDRVAVARKLSSRNPTLIKVRNDSDAVVGSFGVLGLGSPIITPADNESEFKFNFSFSGEEPATSHTSKFCVVLEPLDVGAIGRAVVSGVVPVRLTVSGALADAADVTDGSTATLTNAASGGARVLWAESNGSERWAIVRLGDPVSNSSAAFSGARLYVFNTGTTQTISNTTDTAVTFWDEDYDSGSYWSAGSPGNFVTPSVGIYLLTASIAWESNATGLRHIRFETSASDHNFGPLTVPAIVTASANTYITTSAVVSLAASENVNVRVWQNSGGSLNIINGESSLPNLGKPMFSITRLGAL